MDPILATPEDRQLCELCRTLDLPSLFETSTTKPSLSLPPDILRDYLAIRQQEKCLFCQLILSTFQLNFTSHAFSGKTIAAKFETFAQRGVIPGFGRRLWITGLEPEKDKSQATLSGFKNDSGHCIQSTAKCYSFDWPANPSLQARQVDQHRVDLRLVRSWLDLCRDCHSGDCASGRRIACSQFCLRVIDVIHERVVDTPADCKYVTLSYVWGQAKQVMNRKDTRPTLTKPGGLCYLEIPRTIRDAIDLCKVLGENYLWVDALCIQQDDGEDVKSQIANMDQVYSCAEFTIVAAAGDHCNVGLPGLNGSRNFIQNTADIWGTRLITTHRSPTLGAKTSKWNTRGWTFQENILSKRLLIFADTEVLFRCTRSLWCEDVSAECRDSTIRLSDGQWLNRQVSRSQNALRYTRRLWEKCVEALLVRDFTVESDILNAFKGVSRMMQSELGSFHWGLPENNFERALLWNTSAEYPIARRPGFPSWSWAGWRHEQQKGISPGWVYDSDETSVVTYHRFNGSGELVPIRHGEEPVKLKIDLELRAHFDYPSAPTPNLEEQESRDHLLVFWTSSAIIPLLRIGPNRYIVGGGRYSEQYHFRSFALKDEWYDKQSSGVEFIVISSGSRGNYPVNDWDLDTMIIEWIDGIAYRVQVPGVNTERIPQEFWQSAKPQGKLIILG